MKLVLLILFGAAGTLCRYGLQGLVQHRTGSGFPSGTLGVNLLGCFLLGGIGEFALGHLSVPPEWRVGITIGFFGAFTTFSSFSWEAVQLLNDGEWLKAVLYISASLIGGLILMKVGMSLGERI